MVKIAHENDASRQVNGSAAERGCRRQDDGRQSAWPPVRTGVGLAGTCAY